MAWPIGRVIGSHVLVFSSHPALLWALFQTLILTSNCNSFSKRINFTSTRLVMLFRRGNTCRHRVLISRAKLIRRQYASTLIKYDRYRCIQQRLFKCDRVRKDCRPVREGSRLTLSASDKNYDEARVASYPSNTPKEYEIGRRLRGSGSRNFRVQVVWPVSSLWVAFGRVAVIWGIHDPQLEICACDTSLLKDSHCF